MEKMVKKIKNKGWKEIGSLERRSDEEPEMM